VAFDKVNLYSLFEVNPLSLPWLTFLGCKLTSLILLNLFVALSSAFFLISIFLFAGVFFSKKLLVDLDLLKLFGRG